MGGESDGDLGSQIVDKNPQGGQGECGNVLGPLVAVASFGRVKQFGERGEWMNRVWLPQLSVGSVYRQILQR